jgi:hypothetical protein
MKFKNVVTLISACMVLNACGGGGGGTPIPIQISPPPPPPSLPPPPPPLPPPVPQSVERDVSPAVTNPAINTNLSAHVAINPDPAVAAKGRLFVMLPGTGAFPRFYRFILRTGVAKGYHTIGLTYPNDEAIGTLCATSIVADCAGLARNEVITGVDTSPVVAVNPANSISGRLVAMLTYMAATYPNEGWGQYIVSGQPNWPLITVAGHSQGAGHAAYLGKLQRLDRAVMFSGPSDIGIVGGSGPVWLNLPNQTPASNQYGFTHVNDTLVSRALVERNWGLIGLGAFGASISVDISAAPFANSRQLITSALPNPNPPSPVPDPEHSATVVDAVTPLAPNGTPLFAPVWTYLAFPL